MGRAKVSLHHTALRRNFQGSTHTQPWHLAGTPAEGARNCAESPHTSEPAHAFTAGAMHMAVRTAAYDCNIGPHKSTTSHGRLAVTIDWSGPRAVPGQWRAAAAAAMVCAAVLLALSSSRPLQSAEEKPDIGTGDAVFGRFALSPSPSSRHQHAAAHLTDSWPWRCQPPSGFAAPRAHVTPPLSPALPCRPLRARRTPGAP
jgi:hypothetical protein